MAVAVSSEPASAAPEPPDDDTPRTIVTRVFGGDKVFRAVLRAARISVLVINALILLFLVLRQCHSA